MIETPMAILNCSDIAAAAKRARRAACLLRDGHQRSRQGDARRSLGRAAAPPLYWLSPRVTAARAYGLDVLDGVYNNFKDTDGFRRECVHGRALGFDGKTLIHPDQVAVANEVFAPPRSRGRVRAQDHRGLRPARE